MLAKLLLSSFVLSTHGGLLGKNTYADSCGKQVDCFEIVSLKKLEEDSSTCDGDCSIELCIKIDASMEHCVKNGEDGLDRVCTPPDEDAGMCTSLPLDKMYSHHRMENAGISEGGDEICAVGKPGEYVYFPMKDGKNCYGPSFDETVKFGESDLHCTCGKKIKYRKLDDSENNQMCGDPVDLSWIERFNRPNWRWQKFYNRLKDLWTPKADECIWRFQLPSSCKDLDSAGTGEDSGMNHCPKYQAWKKFFKDQQCTATSELANFKDPNSFDKRGCPRDFPEWAVMTFFGVESGLEPNLEGLYSSLKRWNCALTKTMQIDNPPPKFIMLSGMNDEQIEETNQQLCGDDSDIKDIKPIYVDNFLPAKNDNSRIKHYTLAVAMPFFFSNFQYILYLDMNSLLVGMPDFTINNALIGACECTTRGYAGMSIKAFMVRPDYYEEIDDEGTIIGKGVGTCLLQKYTDEDHLTFTEDVRDILESFWCPHFSDVYNSQKLSICSQEGANFVMTDKTHPWIDVNKDEESQEESQDTSSAPYFTMYNKFNFNTVPLVSYNEECTSRVTCNNHLKMGMDSVVCDECDLPESSDCRPAGLSSCKRMLLANDLDFE